MLRKLITLGALGALGYGIYTFADRSNFFGGRDVDRGARMEQLEDAALSR